GTRRGGRRAPSRGRGLRRGQRARNRFEPRRCRDRHRHRRPAHGAMGTVGGAGAVARLSRRRDAAAAVAVGGPAGAAPQDRADRRAHCRGAGDPGRALMTLYFLLKFLHVIGAAVLLGTGAGIAFFMLAAHRTGEPSTVAAVARIVVIADFLFTATAVVAQPVTGLLLAWNVGYSLLDGWIALSIL